MRIAWLYIVMTSAHSANLVRHSPIFNQQWESYDMWMWVKRGRIRPARRILPLFTYIHMSCQNGDKKESSFLKGDLNSMKLSRRIGSSGFFLKTRSSELTFVGDIIGSAIVLTDLVWLPQWHHIRCVHKVIQSFLYEILRLIACELRYSAMQMSRSTKKCQGGFQGYYNISRMNQIE